MLKKRPLIIENIKKDLTLTWVHISVFSVDLSLVGAVGRSPITKNDFF